MLKIQKKDVFHLIHYFLFIKIKGLNIITCKGYDLLEIIIMCLSTAIENSIYIYTASFLQSKQIFSTFLLTTSDTWMIH